MIVESRIVHTALTKVDVSKDLQDSASSVPDTAHSSKSQEAMSELNIHGKRLNRSSSDWMHSSVSESQEKPALNCT